jgi:hypothetical protein
LVGGCTAGDSSGGAGIQIVSRTRIVIEATAALNANGMGGIAEQGGIGGGGSGGSVLLEAPLVELGQGAAIVANGGAGATGAATGSAGVQTVLTTAPATAPGCGAKPATLCGIGGNGGARDVAPTVGGALVYVTTAGVEQWTGGGGGAAGRIRINTADGTYTRSSDAIESPAPSVSTVRTR